MVPHVGEQLEVAFAVLGHARGPEEGYGLRGEGARADEVAGLGVGEGLARGREGADGHAEAFLLDLACVDGGEGRGGAEE